MISSKSSFNTTVYILALGGPPPCFKQTVNHVRRHNIHQANQSSQLL